MNSSFFLASDPPHALPSIQKRKYQREYKAQQNRSAEWKIKRKVVALIMNIEWKPSETERQFRTQRQNKPQHRENHAHHHEQSAELRHTEFVPVTSATLLLPRVLPTMLLRLCTKPPLVTVN